MEARHRIVNHTPMRWHMEEFAEEKIDVWRCIDHWLMQRFLPVGRSGLDAPSGGVVDRRWNSRRKSSPKNFPGSRGSLMATKDSRDGGELVEVQYNH